MKKGDMININKHGNRCKVEVVKILEWIVKDLAGIIKVKFPNGKIGTIIASLAGNKEGGK